jgi:hypothetical protein
MTVKLVHLNKVGPSGDLYVVRDFHAPTDPGYGGGIPANPVFPNNSLPSGPPTTIQPGEILVMVRDPEGVWHYAALSPDSPPPRPVPPGPPDHISNRPPGSGNYPSGQPVPPVPTPT